MVQNITNFMTICSIIIWFMSIYIGQKGLTEKQQKQYF